MFNVNNRLATSDTMSADESAKIPTDHVFTMTGIANQTMCVLSTESQPGIISVCVATCQCVNELVLYTMMFGKTDGRLGH